MSNPHESTKRQSETRKVATKREAQTIQPPPPLSLTPEHRVARRIVAAGAGPLLEAFPHRETIIRDHVAREARRAAQDAELKTAIAEADGTLIHEERSLAGVLLEGLVAFSATDPVSAILGEVDDTLSLAVAGLDDGSVPTHTVSTVLQAAQARLRVAQTLHHRLADAASTRDERAEDDGDAATDAAAEE